MLGGTCKPQNTPGTRRGGSQDSVARELLGVVPGNSINRFHHLRLPQISCSEEKAVQVASVFLGGAGGGDFVLLTCARSFDN